MYIYLYLYVCLFVSVCMCCVVRVWGCACLLFGFGVLGVLSLWSHFLNQLLKTHHPFPSAAIQAMERRALATLHTTTTSSTQRNPPSS